MAKKAKPTSDAVEILRRRFFESKARLKSLEEARANEEIALKIHELRTAAALTQAQLGRLIGTTASVICRLEDADYEGPPAGDVAQYRGRVESVGRDSFYTGVDYNLSM